MQSGLDSVLWEDLGEIENYTTRVCTTLETITSAIQDGIAGQPNREDSKRLNRLVVLTEMLTSEIEAWASEIEARHQELEPFRRSNGKH